MLTNCPECELQVSDKAITCPHCGYPLRQNSPPRKKRTSKKRRRLPNGFGQISEIKGRNLRNPFRAMITVGKNENGRPICKPLKPVSYFATYNEAYAALVEYNKNPYDLKPSITVQELYEEWSEKHYKNISESRIRGLESAWKHCSSIYSMRVVDVRTRHIKGCIEDNEQHTSSATKINIKALFNMLLDYALEYELIDRNYARAFTVSEEVVKDASTSKRSHIIFTDKEMSTLWKNADSELFVPVMLIQCYSGWRPMEICLMKLEDVDLERWTFRGGLKTKAGKMRTVPIHSRIRPLVEQKYKEAVKLDSDYLINYVNPMAHKQNINLTYKRYETLFDATIEELNLNSEHRPHDTRKHFITMAKKYGLDEYAIKYIVGHTVNDLTEKVYTERDIDWLTEEMKKIK